MKTFCSNCGHEVEAAENLPQELAVLPPQIVPEQEEERKPEKRRKLQFRLEFFMLLSILLPLYRIDGAVIPGVEAFHITEGYVYLFCALGVLVSRVFSYAKRLRLLNIFALIFACGALGTLIVFSFSYPLMYGYIVGLVCATLQFAVCVVKLIKRGSP